jgi:hypothetical protein
MTCDSVQFADITPFPARNAVACVESRGGTNKWSRAKGNKATDRELSPSVRGPITDESKLVFSSWNVAFHCKLFLDSPADSRGVGLRSRRRAAERTPNWHLVQWKLE